MKKRYYAIMACFLAMSVTAPTMSVLAADSATESEVETDNTDSESEETEDEDSVPETEESEEAAAEAESSSETDAKTEFTVTYKVTDADGTVLNEQKTDGLKAGDAMPAFSGQLYIGDDYQFAGWSDTLADTVSGDVEVTTTWKKVEDPSSVHKLTFDASGIDEEGKLDKSLNGASFDVYVNDVLLMSQVPNCELVLNATDTYKIDNITPEDGLVRKDSGTESYSGSMSADVSEQLVFGPEGTAYVPDGSSTDDEKKAYTITLDANGGVCDTASLTSNGEAVKLPAATKEGYTFLGWFTQKEGGEKFTTDYVPAGDVTLYAQYEEAKPTEYTITLDANGGVCDTASLTSNGEAVKLPAATKEGYTFLGWFTQKEGGEKFTTDYVPAGDVTLYAQYEEAKPTEYTITLDANGGVSAVDRIQTSVYIEPAAPTREGYKFLGWFDAKEGGKQFTADYPLTGNLTLYAHWEQEAAKTFTIKFDAQGGSSVDEITGEKEVAIQMPVTIKEGYTFLGWFTKAEGGKQVKDGYKLTKDLTLYAHWEKKDTEKKNYTVTFDCAGGTMVNPETNLTVNKYEKTDVEETVINVSNIPTPTRTGYTFDGWYTEVEGKGSKLTSYVMNANTVFYANWLEVKNTVRISFDTQGGLSIDAQEVTKGQQMSLPTPVKDGYTFAGWYDQPDGQGGNKIDTLSPDEDRTLYAHWTVTPTENCTVTYKDGCDGKVFNDVVYSVAKGSATPNFGTNNPTRDGYTFKGWNPAVAETVTENAVYTAIWDDGKGNNGSTTDGNGNGVSGDGKSGDNISNGGKQDAVANGVKTGDTSIMGVMAAGAAALVALASGLVYTVKKRKKKSE